MATCILNDPHRNALPVLLLRQVFFCTIFPCFFGSVLSSPFGGLLGPFSPPLGANIVRFGGQLGSQDGAEIEVTGSALAALDVLWGVR